MRWNVWFYLGLVLMGGSQLFGVEVVISVSNPSGLQGNGTMRFSSDHATSFDTNDHSVAATLFESTGNLNAFHIRENGNYLVSAQTGYTIDGSDFEDGEVAEYEPATGSASSFVNFENILGEGDVDIDAFSEHPDGRFVFSLLNEAEFTDGPNSGLAIGKNDIVIYDPATMGASILIPGDLLVSADSFLNVSGISVLNEQHIAISASTGGVSDTTFGGVVFQRNDAVLYDLETATATPLIEGSTVFEGPPNPSIDALHVISAVPEPSSCYFLAYGILATACRRRRRFVR